MGLVFLFVTAYNLPNKQTNYPPRIYRYGLQKDNLSKGQWIPNLPLPEGGKGLIYVFFRKLGGQVGNYKDKNGFNDFVRFLSNSHFKVWNIEKGIRIGHPYNFGFFLGNRILSQYG